MKDTSQSNSLPFFSASLSLRCELYCHTRMFCIFLSVVYLLFWFIRHEIFFLCLQGGLSKGYKKYIAEKELSNDTYTGEELALFRVQGSGPEYMQAIQVDPVRYVPIYFILSY